MSEQSLAAVANGRANPGAGVPGSSSGLSGSIARLWSERPETVRLVLFYAAYLAACALARKMQIIPGHTTAFWPAAGIFVATLLSTRRGTWAWYVVAGLLAEMSANVLWFRNPVPAALGFFVANALEALAAAWLLRRFVAVPFELRTSREVVGLVLLGAGLAPIIGATVGSATHHVLGNRSFGSAWALWWLGDASGLLTTLPLALAALQVWQARAEIPLGRLVEAMLTGAALVGTAWLAAKGYLPTPYATLLPLLWAALRFQVRGAAVAVAALTLATALLTVTAAAGLAGDAEAIRQKVVGMQAFLGLSALSALLVATLALQHEQARQALEDANIALERRVAMRTAELAASEEHLRLAQNAAGLGAWEGDLRSGAQVWSERARALVGAGPVETPSLALLLSRVHSEDRARLEAEVCRVRQPRADPAYHVEFRVVHPDGRVRWLEDQGRREGHRIVGVVRDVTERKQADEQLRLLLREVNHRGKNMLGLVQAVARQTAAARPGEFVERFAERLQALAANQDLLVKSEWRGVRLDDLVRSQLAHFADLVGRRIRVEGPEVMLTPGAAQAIGMSVHELATNAGKYGALSTAAGTIDIAWSIETVPDGRRFAMSWREAGGPEVVPPARQGFGSVVTTRMVRMALDGEVTASYARDGFAWHVACDAASVLAGEAPAAAAAEPAAA